MGVSYEDMVVGTTTEIGKHTFTREEIVEFAEKFDPQPFHWTRLQPQRRRFADWSQAVGIPVRS